MRFRVVQIALFTLIVGLDFGCRTPQAISSKSYPPPGKLIDIGGRRLHLNCMGKRSPTVILVAGGGAYSIDWDLVQARIAEGTRVCSFDRAGLGWSDPGTSEETVEGTVGDLHALLHAAGEQEPFVLVGASIGGIFIQAYQRAYPEEIAGLVFSNSSNRIGMKTKDKAGLIWHLSEDELRSAYPLPASARGRAPAHEGDPFDKLPPNLQEVRLWLDMRLWKKSDPTKATPEMILSWRKEFLKEFDLTDAGKRPPLGELPVVVLASDPAATESQRQTRDGAAARLDLLSTNTVHSTATGSGHEIHLYQPDRVIDAVARIVSAVRSDTPLARLQASADFQPCCPVSLP
jgi:pimeloyl-ACP methyl ester carboxylesterase